MDEKIEKAIEPLLEMYEEIENDLLIKIASHFSINEEFLNSDHWRIKKLDEMGLFNQDVIKYISKYTNKTENTIKKALNKIGIDTVDLDKLNRLFEDEVLKINPNILISNFTIKNIIDKAYNELSNRFIEMSYKIEEGVRNAYLNVVEEAYLKTTMGTHSYQEAIRESINELSNKGITTLTYKTTDDNDNVVGIRNYDIESAVRREVLTASRQLSNNISMEVANELECEYVYLSEHLQCRINHFDWQGTIIKRKDLVSVTDYGSVTGLGGINCRHYFEPYFGDARNDELKHFNKEECTNAYKLSQKQRYLERGIRKWKRKAEMYKASDDLEYYSKCKGKVKEWQLRNKQFTEDNNLRRDYTREHVSRKQKIPNFIGFKSKGLYSDEEILTLAKQVKTMSDKYIDIPSKWSGNVQINNDLPSGKMWSCDITTRNNTSAHELLHEMLHSKSISYYKKNVYFENRAFEEIPVQFLTQEISLKEGIELIPSAYDRLVNNLRNINKKCKIEQNDYLFAKRIFYIPVTDRYKSLVNMVENNEEMLKLINEIKEDTLWIKKSKK